MLSFIEITLTNRDGVVEFVLTTTPAKPGFQVPVYSQLAEDMDPFTLALLVKKEVRQLVEHNDPCVFTGYYTKEPAVIEQHLLAAINRYLDELMFRIVAVKAAVTKAVPGPESTDHDNGCMYWKLDQIQKQVKG